MPEYTLLFKILGTRNLQELLDTLLKRRLEAQESFQQNVDGEKTIIQFITNMLNSPLLADPIAELRGMTASVLANDAGDKLTNMLKVLLQLWSEAESSLEDGDGIACAEKLFQAQIQRMHLRVVKAKLPSRNFNRSCAPRLRFFIRAISPA